VKSARQLDIGGAPTPERGDDLSAASGSSIGGKLNLGALSRLHFHVLTRAEQEAAIRKMAGVGMSDYGISHATGLAVEQVRRVIGERDAADCD
jgi:hypothetical protein